MPETLSINELAARIKERRPDLANVPDGTLVGKLLAAEPSLKPMVRMEYSDSRGASFESPNAPKFIGVQPGGTGEKVLEGMENVGQGVKDLPGDILRTGAGAIGAAYDVATKPMSLFEKLKGAPSMAASALKPLQTLTSGAAEAGIGALPESIQAPARAAVNRIAPGVTADVPSPDDPRWAEAQQSAGANLAGTTAAGVASLPAVGRAASSVFTKLKSKANMGTLTKAPELNQWMNVTPKAMEHGANPAQQILDDGLLATTKEATKANVGKALAATGQEMEQSLLDATLKGAPALDATPIVDNALSSVVKKIGTPRDTTFQNTLSAIKSDIVGSHPNLSALTPKQSQSLISHLGESINWHAVAENPINDALIQIYRDLRKAQVTTQVPDLAPILSKWQNLYVSDKSLGGSMLKDAAGVGTGKSLLFNKIKSGAKKVAIVGGGAYGLNKVLGAME